MNNFIKTLAVAFLASQCLCGAAHAYNVQTHSRITQAISQRASGVFGDLTLLTGLRSDTVIGGQDSDGHRFYYDFNGSNIYLRHATQFALDNLPQMSTNQSLTAAGWLMRGSVREDDLPWWVGGSFVDRDPFGSFEFRPLNHFCDPQNSYRPLTVAVPLPAHECAMDWALGTTNFTQLPLVPDSTRRDHFTIFDAREAMFRAVTGETSAESTDRAAIVPDGSGHYRDPIDAAEAEQSRKAYWATTFRALGDVLHLIEDMAQPQHTRNDAHNSDYGVDATVYEKYTDRRATGAYFHCNNRDPIPTPPLVFSGYPIVQFNNYSDYFSTGASSWKGIADFSSTNFYTAGTNIGNNADYALPDDSTMTSTDVRIDNPCIPTNNAEYIDRLYFGSVMDHENPSTSTSLTHVALSARGVFDNSGLFSPSTDPAKNTLTEENYDEMADILIPRAVGYGAGFLNYFFRGRLDIEQPDDGVYAIVDHATVNSADDGFRTLKVKIKNVTPDVVLADGTTYTQNMGAGDLYAVVRYHRNPCYQPNLAGEYIENGGADDPEGPGDTDYGISMHMIDTSACGGATDPTPVEEIAVSDNVPVTAVTTDFQLITFKFSKKPVPINATDVYLEIVFRGKLGTENDAVVVANKDISEPTYVSITNSTDYIGVNSVLYTKADIQGDSALGTTVDQNGNNNGVLDENLDAGALTYVRIGFAGDGPYLVEKDSLAPDESIRVAVLQDRQSSKYDKLFWENPNGASQTATFSGEGEIDCLRCVDDTSYIHWVSGFDDWDEMSNNPNWVGAARGFHIFKGVFVFDVQYDRGNTTGLYDVSGLASFDSAHLAPVPVDRILGGY